MTHFLQCRHGACLHTPKNIPAIRRCAFPFAYSFEGNRKVREGFAQSTQSLDSIDYSCNAINGLCIFFKVATVRAITHSKEIAIKDAGSVKA